MREPSSGHCSIASTLEPQRPRPERRGGGGGVSYGCGMAAPALIRRHPMIKTFPLNKLVASPRKVEAA
jgi:hypothetical protein